MPPAMSDMEPFFPPELEKAIFEYAAESAPECIPVFLLVCMRVYYWIEPVLYKTITALGEHTTLPALALLQCHDLPQDFPPYLAERLSRTGYPTPKSPAFLHSNVRNLYTEETSTAALLFPLCTGVHTLYFNVFFYQLPLVPSIFPLLFALKLRRLSMPLQPLVDNLSSRGHPFFATITHFQALDRDVPNVTATHWPSFLAAHFPALTHVSFSSDNVSIPGGYTDIRVWMVNFYMEVLQLCTTLQVFVHFYTSEVDAYTAQFRVPKVDDIRAVCVYVDEGFTEADWVKDLRGRTDVWMRAETVIEERRLIPPRVQVHRAPYQFSDADIAFCHAVEAPYRSKFLHPHDVLARQSYGL
ncbi:hypothetical protein R3P38DRAFT_1634455 [Favolaschia claudopus]|uniref:Uncharacterized protein n=1 Tax=Favolaschia claudopus TaxID=2862362 RepID=A0AAW0DM36_9AGAR